MEFDYLLSQLNYPEPTRQALDEALSAKACRIEDLAQTAYQGEDLRFPLCNCLPLTRLAVVTWLLKGKFQDYRKRGIPENVILDTFRDVPLRAELYRKKTGEAGISEEDVIWFRHIMNENIFRIGSLQYQPFSMVYLDQETIGEPYMTFSAEQKQILPVGAPVLNCHIPVGADLSDAAVSASLDEARRFFAACFPAVAFRVFLCYSWLLYPPMTGQLPARSHIRQFASRFSIIGACNDPDQAGECLRPGDSTLGRLMRQRPELFGFACGVIPLSG